MGFMSFFDSGQDKRSDIENIMWQAQDRFNPGELSSIATQNFLPDLMQAANEAARFETIGAKMSARSSEASINRLLGPGSGVGGGMSGFTLGAGYGVSSTLRAKAMEDAYNMAFRRAGSVSSILMQGQIASAAVPTKSPWDVVKDVTNTAGSYFSGFGGDPTAGSPTPSSGGGVHGSLGGGGGGGYTPSSDFTAVFG